MKKFRTMGVLMLFFSLLVGCSRYLTQPLSKTVTLFDTIVTIKIYDKDSEAVLNQCIAQCQDYESRFSRTLEGSEIYQLNHAGGQAVELSDDTIELIQLGLKYSELTDGKFDITIAPLSDVWDFKNNSGKIPDEKAIQEAKRHIGYQNVQINGNHVRLLDPKASIDLGAVAKGFIADKLKEYMLEQGVDHALIDLGGNVLAIGGKPNGSSYNIGIQKPFDQMGASITSVKIEDGSIVSSGIYQRYFKIGETIYHHILNPVTGYPYDNDLLGVTIICDSSADADCLSTACFVLGENAGMQFINNMPGAEAVFVTKDYKLHYSSGFPK